MVFSDVVMPGTNGLDLARTIRSRLPDLPIILTSGYSELLARDPGHGFTLLRKRALVGDAVAHAVLPCPWDLRHEAQRREARQQMRQAAQCHAAPGVRINTVAPFALTRACLPLLKQAADASVVFVGETHGQHPGPFWGAFGASKAGLGYLVKVAANEWDVWPQLRTNLLVPGPVNSPQRTRTHPGEAKSERGELAALMPHMLYWLGQASVGRSGEIIELDLRPS